MTTCPIFKKVYKKVWIQHKNWLHIILMVLFDDLVLDKNIVPINKRDHSIDK
jgi:hypothetical protein